MNLSAEIGAGMTGLEQLKALIAGGRRPPIGELMEFDLVEIEDGRVVFEGTPTLRVYNPIGSVHGGYAATCSIRHAGVRPTPSFPRRRPIRRSN